MKAHYTLMTDSRNNKYQKQVLNVQYALHLYVVSYEC